MDNGGFKIAFCCVKVWFQNRRMKWRHAQQRAKSQAGQTGSDGDNTANNNATSANDNEPASSDKSSDDNKQLDISTGSDDMRASDVTPADRNTPSRDLNDAASPRFVIADDVEVNDNNDVAVDLSRSRQLAHEDIRMVMMQHRDDVERIHDDVMEDCCSEAGDSDSDCESIDV